MLGPSKSRDFNRPVVVSLEQIICAVYANVNSVVNWRQKRTAIYGRAT